MKRQEMESKKLGKKVQQKLLSKLPEVFTPGNFSINDKGCLVSPEVFDKSIHLSMLGKLSRFYDSVFNVETPTNTPAEVKTEVKTVTTETKKRHRRTKAELIADGYIKGDKPIVKKHTPVITQPVETVQPSPVVQPKQSNDIVIPVGATITFTATWVKQ